MIMLYIVEENIFAVIVYKFLVQKKYQNVISKAALTLIWVDFLGVCFGKEVKLPQNFAKLPIV